MYIYIINTAINNIRVERFMKPSIDNIISFNKTTKKLVTNEMLFQ